MNFAACGSPPTGAAAAFVGRFAEVVPELLTDRLRLRAPRISDYPVYSGFVRNDRGAGLAERGPDRESWLDFCEMIAGWPLRGFGPWTLEPRAGGAALGLAILGHEFGDPEPEIGWLVTPEAEGQGYATEGARAALGHAFGVLGFETLVSYVAVDNPRSMRVAERLGGRRDAATEAQVEPGTRVYRHSPPEAAE